MRIWYYKKLAGLLRWVAEKALDYNEPCIYSDYICRAIDIEMEVKKLEMKETRK